MVVVVDLMHAAAFDGEGFAGGALLVGIDSRCPCLLLSEQRRYSTPKASGSFLASFRGEALKQ